MSSLASRPKKKQVRRKNNSGRGRNGTKRDRNIINDLADKFENLFQRTHDKLMKPVKEKYGHMYTTSNEYNEIIGPLFEAGCDVDILTKLVCKPYSVKIKLLEKIYEKMLSIFKYEKDKCKIFNLSPIHILKRPFTFIMPSERYISFDKACSITEKLGLDYKKRDVFCAFLYQITTVHKSEVNTPYIDKSNVKGFYKNGIQDTRSKKQYKLPIWCNYMREDKDLLVDIVKSECNEVIIDDKTRVVLNYIYEMENKSNEYLSEFIDLKDSKHTFIIENSEELISNYENDQAEGFRFTSGQKDAIKQCMEDQFSIVLGLPGTGKTEIVKCIMKIFGDYYKQSGKECIVSLTAPTGAAIKNLSSRCDDVLNDSSRKLYGTMHKLCYGVYKLIRDPNCEKYRGLYPDIIVVDEISMADMDIFYRLLVHIKYFKETNRTPKIILLGDDNQLPSVGYGNVLGNIIKSELFSSFKLTEIMRNSGGIAKAIKKMNDGKLRLTRRDFNTDDFQFLDLNDFKDLGEEIFKSSRNMIKLLDGIEFNIQRDRIIVAQNATKDEKLNPWLQNQYLLKNLTVQEKTERQIYQYAYTNKKGNTIHTNYYDNDRIVRTKNITTAQGIYLTNGDTGNIFKLTKKNFEMCVQKSPELRKVISDETQIEIGNETVYAVPNKVSIASDNVDKEGRKKNIVLDFTRDSASYTYTGIVLYDTKEFELVRDIDIREEIELAYCTTVHKAQGAEFDNVIVWLECWMWWTEQLKEKKKLFYTALSRAKKKCIIIGRHFNIKNVQENRKVNRLSWFLSESWINESFAIE